MGLYDRDYAQSGSRQQYYGAPQMRLNLPRVTPVVKWLLGINIGIHLLQALLFSEQMKSLMVLTPLEVIFAVFPETIGKALQIWRLVSYQFLHANGFHIFGNMLGLYFLGPTLEKNWGSRRFLIFYLSCGLAGGLLYTALVGFGAMDPGPMVGASGSILGMLAACAILFPHFVVFIVIFPVPIRVAAIGLMMLYMLNVLLDGGNSGGDAAHLGGMAAGAAYVLLGPRLATFKLKSRTGSWEKKIENERTLQIEVDRILAKVHDCGLHSLTGAEKRILKKATQEEVKRNHVQ